jgi:hypothetical protein
MARAPIQVDQGRRRLSRRPTEIRQRRVEPAKISDVTGGGLYLFVTPDKSRPGSAASKLWRMAYRFHSRQKTYSIGPYRNGKDGTFSLADARRERDKATNLLKEGKTRAPRSSSTNTGRRRSGLSSNGPTSGSRRRKWRKSNVAGLSRCATPRPSRCSSCASATSRLVSASCVGRTSSVRTCSLSCVHTNPKESWKPATACAASVMQI